MTYRRGLILLIGALVIGCVAGLRECSAGSSLEGPVVDSGATADPPSNGTVMTTPDPAVPIASTGDPPFDEAARALAGQIQRDVIQRVGPTTRLAGFAERPWILMVEDDPGWIPEAAARRRLEALVGLEAMIRRDLGDVLDLKPIPVPVPLPGVVFRNTANYVKYLTPADPGALAHFDRMTGRFAFDDQSDLTTLLQEGARVLLHHCRAGWPAAADPCFWFEEGIAAWYAGTRSAPAPGGSWSHEEGLLHPGHLDAMHAATGEDARGRLFTLGELLDIREPGRHPGISPDDLRVLRAQAWFLAHFLNRYNVDADGQVHPDQGGTHRQGWLNLVREEFQGRTGREAFLRSLGIDAARFEEVEKEHWRWLGFVMKKINLQQVRDGRILRWDGFVDRKGRVRGETSDDRLPPFDPERAPTRRR